MKTAMQELIDDLLSGKIIDILSNEKKYLKKEKQQIIDAYGYGSCDNHDEFANKYYNETFKND